MAGSSFAEVCALPRKDGHMNRYGTRVALDTLTAAWLLQIYLWGAMTLLSRRGAARSS